MRIAICDDSKSELIWVSKEIRNVFERKHIFLEEKQYTSANRMLVENKKQPFDVIFLDLDMKEINGMDVAFEINKLNMATEIVFVTNHDELVYKAYQFKALGFVRKQYLSDEIDEIVDLIIKLINERQRYIVFENRESEKKYRIEEIVYMRSEDHYIDIITLQDKFLIRTSMGNLEKQYSEYGFLRLHSRYIVNFSHIYSIEKNAVVLDDKKQLPLSRNRVKEVKEQFKQYVRFFL